MNRMIRPLVATLCVALAGVCQAQLLTVDDIELNGNSVGSQRQWSVSYSGAIQGQLSGSVNDTQANSFRVVHDDNILHDISPTGQVFLNPFSFDGENEVVVTFTLTASANVRIQGGMLVDGWAGNYGEADNARLVIGSNATARLDSGSTNSFFDQAGPVLGQTYGDMLDGYGEWDTTSFDTTMRLPAGTYTFTTETLTHASKEYYGDGVMGAQAETDITISATP